MWVKVFETPQTYGPMYVHHAAQCVCHPKLYSTSMLFVVGVLIEDIAHVVCGFVLAVARREVDDYKTTCSTSMCRCP